MVIRGFHTCFTSSGKSVDVRGCLIDKSAKYLLSTRAFADPVLLPRNQSSINLESIKCTRGKKFSLKLTVSRDGPVKSTETR